MDDAKLYLTILMEEYKSLRDESKQASINMLSALRWGVEAAVLGVGIGVGFTAWNRQHLVVFLIFYVVVPVLSAMSVFLWLGEAIRFKRAGDYICLIEQKAGMIFDEFTTNSNFKAKWEKLQRKMEINLKISPSNLILSDPLVWEQWLRDMRKSITEGHLSLIYLIRLAFFPTVMCFSLVTATYYALTHPRFTPHQLIWMQSHIPEAKIGVLYLLVLWGLIFVVSMTISSLIAWRLRVKVRPTIRTSSETE